MGAGSVPEGGGVIFVENDAFIPISTAVFLVFFLWSVSCLPCRPPEYLVAARMA